jgi:hypothetical protein
MVTLDGSDAVMIPSSFDVDNVLELGSMNDVFNLEVKAIYQLQWQTAESKSQMLEIINKSGVLRFIFNYRTDYEGMDALLIESNQEIFLLAGQMLDFDYLENKIVVTQENTVNVEPEEEEDLDFGML